MAIGLGFKPELLSVRAVQEPTAIEIMYITHLLQQIHFLGNSLGKE